MTTPGNFETEIPTLKTDLFQENQLSLQAPALQVSEIPAGMQGSNTVPEAFGSPELFSQSAGEQCTGQHGHWVPQVPEGQTYDPGNCYVYVFVPDPV